MRHTVIRGAVASVIGAVSALGAFYGVDAIAQSAPCKSAAYVPAQLDYDGSDFMHEDETPEEGPDGGELIDYSDGWAVYGDRYVTDGRCWYYTGGK